MIQAVAEQRETNLDKYWLLKNFRLKIGRCAGEGGSERIAMADESGVVAGGGLRLRYLLSSPL